MLKIPLEIAFEISRYATYVDYVDEIVVLTPQNDVFAAGNDGVAAETGVVAAEKDVGCQTYYSKVQCCTHPGRPSSI